MRHKRRSSRPFAWSAALLFNALLIGGVKLAADTMSAAYGGASADYQMSTDAIAATRDALGRAFDRFDRAEGETPREHWARRVNLELLEDDLSAAEGFLLAAPHMLKGNDAEAVIAAANTVPTGTSDERLVEAAILFLPDDVRALYEDRTAAPEPDLAPEAEESEQVEPPAVSNPEAPASQVSGPDVEDGSFFVLGSVRDLSFQCAGWLRGDRTDVFGLTLSGLGIAMNEDLIAYQDEATFIAGASILKSAARAGRMDPDFRLSIEQRLYAAIPPDRLRAKLEQAFAENSSLLIEGESVLQAFADAVDLEQLSALETDLARLVTTSEITSTMSTVELLEHVSDSRDLARFELIVRAGGDRVATLVKYQGRDVLNSAQRLIDWNRSLILQIMGLAAIAVTLLWLALGTLGRSLFRNQPVTMDHPADL